MNLPKLAPRIHLLGEVEPFSVDRLALEVAMAAALYRVLVPLNQELVHQNQPEVVTAVQISPPCFRTRREADFYHPRIFVEDEVEVMNWPRRRIGGKLATSGGHL